MVQLCRGGAVMPAEGFLSRFLGCGLAACFMFSTYSHLRLLG